MTVSRDVRLNIIAETKKYQQELAKLPGFTAKQAAAAGRRWEAGLSKGAIAAAKEQERQAVVARKAQEKAADGATKAWSGFSEHLAANLSSDLIKSAATGLFDFAASTFEARTEMINLSEATNIGLDTLAGLQVAAERSGVPFEEITGTLEDFGEVLFDFANGGGRAAEALELLDVKVEKVGGGFRNTDTVLREVLGKMVAVEDQGKRNAIAQQLFGDAGNRLNAVLKDGAIEDYIAAAEDLGLVIDEEGIRKTKEWNIATAELSQVFRGAGADLADFLDAGANIADFNVGFIFMKELLTELSTGALAAVGDQLGGIALVLNGDFAAGMEKLRLSPTGTLNEMAAGFESAKVSASEATVKFLQNRAALEEEAEAAEDTSKTLAELAEQQDKAAKAAAKAAADRERAAKKLAREQDKAAKEFEKGLVDQARAVEQLAAVHASATSDQLNDIERIFVARDAELAKIAELEMAIGDTAAADAARVAVVERSEREIAAIREEARAAEAVAMEEAAAVEQADADDRLGRIATWVNVTANAFSTATDLAADHFGRRSDMLQDQIQETAAAHDDWLSQRTELEEALTEATDAETRAALESDLVIVNSNLARSDEILAAQRVTARKAFAARKAMEIASIIISGAGASIGALLPPPVGGGVTPLGAALAATAAAATAGAVATVASQSMPQFDAGFAGFTKGPDNFAAIIRDGEGVTNQRATDALGGAAGIQELNQTGSMPSRSMSVRLMVGGRQLGMAIVDEMRAGRELAAKLNQGRRMGVQPVFATR